MDAKYCDIFWSFFKVGTFTIGGGYAMIPLMERELVARHRWLSSDEFLDTVALAQALPGVFAVNMASLTGQRLRGVPGALVAVAANILVPILIILLLAIFFRSFRQIGWVDRMFLGLRPAVVALIAAPVLRMGRKLPTRKDLIPLFVALVAALLGLNPVLIILLAIAAGLLLSLTHTFNLKS